MLMSVWRAIASLGVLRRLSDVRQRVRERARLSHPVQEPGRCVGPGDRDGDR